MYANHYEKRMNSMHHAQREDSPVVDDIPMSPNTRRRTEFTLKQLQNGVLGRARSTLSSWGDVLKPKSNNNNNNKNTGDPSPRPNSSPLNQRTLEFFMTWSRHKKPTDAAAKGRIDALNLMPSDAKHGDKSHRHLNYANFFNGNQSDNNRFKPKLPLSPPSRAKANGKIKSSAIMELSPERMDASTDKNPNVQTNKWQSSVVHGKNKRLTTIAQHKSLDIDDLLEEDDNNNDTNTTHVNHGHAMTMNNAIRRSFDDNINYLGCDGHDDAVDENDYEEKPRRRRTWNISLNESLLDGDGFYGSTRRCTSVAAEPAGRATVDDGGEEHSYKESVIRARLKLKKISVNDDLMLNQTALKTRGILFRHNSVEPNAAKERCQSPSMNSNHDSDSSENRARKKITFREPIVLGKYDGIRSDALERAERFLAQYDRGQGIVRPKPEQTRRRDIAENRRPGVILENRVTNHNLNDEQTQKTGNVEKIENVKRNEAIPNTNINDNPDKV